MALPMAADDLNGYPGKIKQRLPPAAKKGIISRCSGEKCAIWSKRVGPRPE
jgi:hypothetical protein